MVKEHTIMSNERSETMRYKFNELERKYLDLVEKREDGEELNEMEEYALNTILDLSKQGTRNEYFEVMKFFTALDRLLVAEGL